MARHVSFRCMAAFLSLLLLLPAVAQGQRAQYGKLSGQLRQWVREEGTRTAARKAMGARGNGAASPMVCAFVQTRTGADAEALRQRGCQVLLRHGDISIVQMPLAQVPTLSADSRVRRIEARGTGHTLLDSVYIQIGAREVYSARQLPQAFTGQGVVVGVQDVGFDLTHPNFLATDGATWRIRRFWDQLSPDTLGSPLPVGAAYESEADIRAYGHSRDAQLISHGTHTLGCAAGTGFGTSYRGIAYDSDLCLVSNAVSTDAPLIDSTQIYKYTSATDALGFQYIFDYARQTGQPCVVNFSEGATQGFSHDDLLFHTMLQRMTGPGRILVASAGNDGYQKNYFDKPKGQVSAGVFMCQWANRLAYNLKADGAFQMRVSVWENGAPQVHTVDMNDVLATADSTLTDTVSLCGDTYVIEMGAYASCYDARDVAYDVLITGPQRIGLAKSLSVEVMGDDTNVEFFRVRGLITEDRQAPQLNAADESHCINSPANAPGIIAVGATAYRTRFVNSQGATYPYNAGTKGERATFSAIGPTLDGRVKPDVMAPGVNVISSYSSWYIEQKEEPEGSLVATFPYNGRVYGWQADSGTSMSAPVVTGVVALWLQARPDLSPDDVMDVLRHTCRQPDPSLAYPNNAYGYGEIDAYRGLLYVLGIDGIEGLSHHQPRGASFTVGPQGCVGLRLSEVPSRPFSVRLYTADGQLLRSQAFAPGQSLYTLPLPRHGLYVLQIDGGEAHIQGSTLVRW